MNFAKEDQTARVVPSTGEVSRVAEPIKPLYVIFVRVKKAFLTLRPQARVQVRI